MNQPHFNQAKKPGILSYIWTVPASVVCYLFIYFIFLFSNGHQYGYLSVFVNYSGWIILFLAMFLTYQIIKNISYVESKNNYNNPKRETRATTLLETSFTFFTTAYIINIIIFVLGFFLRDSLIIIAITILFSTLCSPIQILTQILNQFLFFKKGAYLPVLFWIFVTVASFLVFYNIDRISTSKIPLYLYNRDWFNFSISVFKPLIISSFMTGIIDFIFYKRLLSKYN